MAIERQPVYQQLSRALRELVTGGEITRGKQFLTEREVCERFEVSRPTANKALANLVVEGVLEFKKGVGTFVRSDVLEYDMRSLVSFTEKARASGRKPSTNVLRFEELAGDAVDATAASQLRLKPPDAVFYMERLRRADRAPVIYERRFVVARFCPGLTARDAAGSLYELWADRYALEIAGADETIRAVAATAAEARELKVRAGSAALLVESTGYLGGDRPLWYERTIYRGDAYEFRTRLGALCPSRPAVGKLT